MINLSPRQRRLLWRVLSVGVVLVSLFFLGKGLIDHWQTVQGRINEVNWGYFAFAVLLLCVAWVASAIPTYLSLRKLTGSATLIQSVALYSVSQLGKYLPGGLWSLPGRAVLYQRYYRVGSMRSMLSVIDETIALLVGALLVGGLGIGLVEESLLVWAWAALAAGSLLFLVWPPRSQRWQTRWTAPFLRWATPDNPLGFRVRLMMVLGGIAFWGLTGSGFYVLLSALPGGSETITAPEAIGGYALAWTVGFLAIVVPAGLGVRESGLALLLSPIMGEADAIFIALLARFWWTIAEFIWTALGLALSWFAFRTVEVPSQGENVPGR